MKLPRKDKREQVYNERLIKHIPGEAEGEEGRERNLRTWKVSGRNSKNLGRRRKTRKGTYRERGETSRCKMRIRRGMLRTMITRELGVA